MKIAVCYTAVARGPITEEYCTRFVTTYNEYPPGVDCDLFVICNGGPLSTSETVLFSGLNAMMFPRSNDAWDIGGYHDAAKGPCAGYDMMLCCGESVYFHRSGWMKRLEEAWKKYGPGMYGPFASNLLRSHLNTSAFCVHPILLQNDSLNYGDRYAWEHGQNAFWRVVWKHGMPVRLVTWDGEWLPREWRSPANILWRGNQSNCLMLCNHTERWANAPIASRLRWSANADRPFK